MSSDLITIRGSYGTLTAHRASGLITGGMADVWHATGPNSGYGTQEEGIAPEYADILMFDATRWPTEAVQHGEVDILSCSFITDRGQYVREVPFVDVGEGWQEWAEPFGLLPAPQ